MSKQLAEMLLVEIVLGSKGHWEFPPCLVGALLPRVCSLFPHSPTFMGKEPMYAARSWRLGGQPMYLHVPATLEDWDMWSNFLTVSFYKG